MTRSPRIALAAAALGAAASCMAAAPAGATSAGVFSISPARRVIQARPPVRISPMTVRNTTQAVFRVTVFAAPLTQAPDGSYAFSAAPSDLVTARKILSVGPKHFTLRPGQAQNIGLRWNLLPLHAKAAPIGVVVVGKPVQAAAGRGVQNILQIVGSHFLRLPGHFAIHGRLEGLTAAQGPGPTLLFGSLVRNEGQVYISPNRARLRIRDTTGRVVARLRWHTGLVLPGVTRKFPALLTKRLPAGTYTAESTLHFGSTKRAQRASTSFTLAGPNHLPTGDLRVLGVSVTGHVGESVMAHVSVRNAGTKAVGGVLGVKLLGYRGSELDKRPLATRSVRFPLVGPGKRLALDIDLGTAAKQPYEVDVALAGDERPTASATAGFVPGAKRSFATKVGDWLSGHAVLLVVLLALLAVGAVGWLGLRSRRRLELELARARAHRDGGGPRSAAAVPPPPPHAPPAGRRPRTPRPQPSPAGPAAGTAPTVASTRPERAASPPARRVAAPVANGARVAPPVTGAPVANGARVAPPVTGAPVANGARGATATVAGPRQGGRVSDECVRLNSSSVEELSRLLGIGGADAQRIVEHRPFGSLLDLRAVEGFDAQRIAQLLWRVRIEP